MLSDPMTLYKLMNLYMLKHVNFPLTNSQLTDFFLAHEYATYFTLQQALNELSEAGLIHAHSNHNTTRYEISREGEDTLEFFGSNIPSAIVADMEDYLEKHRYRMPPAWFPIITSLPVRIMWSTVRSGRERLLCWI